MSDAPLLAAIWSDPAVTRYLGGPRNFEEVRQLIEDEVRQGPSSRDDLWPVVEESSGRIVGHCGLLEKEVDGQTETEVNYIFASFAWGQGYATEAALALRDYAFSRLGLSRIIALIDPDNVASAKVAEKVGLRLERETRRPSGKILRVYATEANLS